MPGRYQIIKKLATGGMAEVFLARAAGPGGFEKTLVVKRILPQFVERPSFVRMFFAEARIAAQLTHPNIVQVFDFGEDEGSYFIAMEYIDGVTLRAVSKWSQANEPLPPTMAAKLVALAAEGLGWAHAYANPETGEPLGLVHRDVSTDNVMVSRTGAVKVLDFGVVRIEGEESVSQVGTLKGKVAYMPREQIAGLPLDGRVDVYALGVVLFVLLTGQRPFDMANDVALMHAIINDAPRPVTTFRDDVPPALVAIIERAMARDRDDRFADCRELQEALERFIATQGAVVSTAQLGQLATRVLDSRTGGEPRSSGSRSGAGSNSRSGGGASWGGVTASAAQLASGLGSWSGAAQQRPGVEPLPAPDPFELTDEEPPTSIDAGVALFDEPLSPRPLPPQPRASAPAIEAIAAPAPRPSAPGHPAPRALASPTLSPPGIAPVSQPSAPPPITRSAPAIAPPPSAPGPFSSRGGSTRVLTFRSEPVPYLPQTLVCAPTRGQPVAVLSALRTAVMAERSELLFRKFFPLAARLMEASPNLLPWVGWHAGGLVAAALVTDNHAALARLIDRVNSAPGGGGRFGAWLRAELSSPRVWLYLVDRLRGAPVEQAAAFEQWVIGLGSGAVPLVMAAIDQLEPGPAQDILVRALAAMVGDPTPIIERLEASQPRQVSAWAQALERCPLAPDRKKVFARLLSRREVPLMLEVMAGRAKAGSPDAIQQLEAGVGDRAPEVRLRALELMGELPDPGVVRVLTTLLTDGQFDKRPELERVTLITSLARRKDLSVSDVLAQVCSEKASILNRKRLAQQRLPIVDGLGRANTDEARRALDAFAADPAQPDEVREAARRQLAQLNHAPAEPRLAPDQFARLRRLAVLELLALVRGALAVDATGGLFDGALDRLRENLRVLVNQEGRFELAVATDGVTVNGMAVPFSFAGASLAPELARLLAACDLKALRLDSPVPVTALRAGLLQLTDPDGTPDKAPHLQLTTFSGRVVQPVLPTPVNGDVTARCAELVARAWAFVRAQREPVAAGGMIPVGALEPLVNEWVTIARAGAWRLLAVSATPPGEHLSVHAINTACIATAFGAELRLDLSALRELVELSLVSTLGEVGLAGVQPGPPGAPMSEEQRLRLGVAFLAHCKHRRGPATAVTAFETGLERPLKAQVRGAGVTASIVAIAEAWDALAQEGNRGHAAALEVLRGRAARRFAPELFSLFASWVEAQGA